MTIKYFSTPALLREWFEMHHATATEFWVGFRKKGSGLPSITWPESVDAALCFGWIDGIRKNVDATSYKIRFTPRKATSTWSNINIRRAQELEELEWLEPAGRKAFAARRENRSGIYSYEQRSEELPEPYAKYIYRTVHADAFRKRKEWFEDFGGPSLALWWLPAGTIPTLEEAKKRLVLLVASGPTADAFGFRGLFPKPPR